MRRREEQKRCIILSKLQDIVPLGGEPFDLWGPGGWKILKKKILQPSPKQRKKVWGKMEKKILDTKKSSNRSPPWKKSNGSPLTVENLFV